MAGIHITDIESAINYWREKAPSPDGFSLQPPVRALAEVYARMVFFHATLADEFTMPAPAYAAWLAWYNSTPDTPCVVRSIASRSTNGVSDRIVGTLASNLIADNSRCCGLLMSSES